MHGWQKDKDKDRILMSVSVSQLSFQCLDGKQKDKDQTLVSDSAIVPLRLDGLLVLFPPHIQRHNKGLVAKCNG